MTSGGLVRCRPISVNGETAVLSTQPQQPAVLAKIAVFNWSADDARVFNEESEQVRRTICSVSFLAMLFVCMGCDRPPATKTPHPPQSQPPASKVTATPEARPEDWFDTVQDSGIEFRYQTGREAGHFTILETVGGGVAAVDFDVDGWADVLCAGGGTIDVNTAEPLGAASGLFRNLGNWQFSHHLAIDTSFYSHGCYTGDANNDGFPDVLITGYNGCQLLLNLGDGTFEASGLAELELTGWHTGAAFADIDQDGDLDIYLADYVDWKSDPLERCPAPANTIQDVCAPQKYDAARDHLLLNDGRGTFTEATEAAGLRADGKGLGVLAADLNGDGQVDIYVANDVVSNHLYVGGAMPLREMAEPTGVAYNAAGTPEGSMGIAWGDVDGDGLSDLLVTNFELEDNSLYQNAGSGYFLPLGIRFGLGGIGRSLVGFGTGLHDFDGDSWPDLYVLNGHVRYHSEVNDYAQSPLLLKNSGGTRFEDITPSGGVWFRAPHTARGGAVADFDNDGALDLVVSSLEEPLTCLRNTRSIPATTRIRLVGTESPRDPIGAEVLARTEQREILCSVTSGAGYLSQSDPRITLSGKATSLLVTWPSGRREQFENLSSGDVIVVEATGRHLGARRPDKLTHTNAAGNGYE